MEIEESLETGTKLKKKSGWLEKEEMKSMSDMTVSFNTEQGEKKKKMKVHWNREIVCSVRRRICI